MNNWPTFISFLYLSVILSSYDFGSGNATPEIDGTKYYEINSTCLNCIAIAISNCDKSQKCVADICGVFHITEPYWIDGNRHTVNGDDPSTHIAYQNCANDITCATQTAADYLKTHARDCDGNGVTDCYDYAGIHKWGPFGGCQKNPIINSGSYYDVLRACLECPNEQCLNIENF